MEIHPAIIANKNLYKQLYEIALCHTSSVLHCLDNHIVRSHLKTYTMG